MASATIRVRLTAWYLLLLTLVLCLLGLLLHLYLGYTLRSNLDRSLVHRAEQLVAIRDLPQAMADGRFAADPGEVVALYDSQGRRLRDPSADNSVGVNPARVESALRGESSFSTERGQDGRSLRLYALPYPAATSPMALVAARPMDNITAAQRALLRTFLVVGPLTLLLSAGGGLFLARRALKPIDRMTATTRKIEEADLGGRIDVRSNDELGRLGQTLNDMLDRLERAFTRQRQFTGDASHELRGPLSVIEAEATLALRRERSSEEYQAALATIAEEAGGMKRLIDQLLDLARADEGQERLSRELIDLAAVAAEVVGELAPVAEEREIALHFENAPPAIVCGDRGHLRRLLLNLVDNGIRYSDAGGTVVVRAYRAGDAARAVVSDTGIGIPPEHLSRVFERFYRVDAARSRGGAGLGLALCQAIARAHGGTIDVESVLGTGTTFTVTLPIG